LRAQTAHGTSSDPENTTFHPKKHATTEEERQPN
jgi:hypothetical protein